ncbi:hypothetical protein [Nitrospira sp. Nam80]
MWITPPVLFLLCALSYGSLIPWLGFYWDDWPAMWVLHSLGGEGIRDYMSTDRPFLGWLYSVTYPLIGESPPAWHAFALIARWLIAVAAWWTLQGLWPENRQEAAMVACLFAVYPGFTLQPIAWTLSHVFVIFALFMFSLGAMVWAQRSERLFWPLTLSGLLSSAVTLLISEYFVGLELLRPVLLWIVFNGMSSGGLHRLTRTIRAWTPYLTVLVGYLCWRVFLFHPSGVNDQWRVLNVITADPMDFLLHRLYVVMTDLVEAGVIAWAHTASIDVFTFASVRWIALTLVVATAGAAIVYPYLRRLGCADQAATSEVQDYSESWSRQAIAFGLFAMLAGGLPFWLGNRDLKLASLSDRYSLQLMLGSAVLLVGVTRTITRRPLQQVAIVSILVGLSIGLHVRNTVQFHQDWTNQQSLFWQLSWRAPGLKPGTAVLVDESVVSFPAGHSFIGPVNFIYAPHHSATDLDYGFFALSTILGDELRTLESGIPWHYSFRTLSFGSSTSKSLVFWFSPPSCLRLLDVSRDELPQLPPLARAARSISHIDRILPNPSTTATLPRAIFGPEPDHSWCYYFQKADLARQQEDWLEVSRLGDEARQRGLAPGDSTEWLPVVEGYLQAGRPQDAKDLMAWMIDDILAVQPVSTPNDMIRMQRRPSQQVVPIASTELCRLLSVLTSSDSRGASPMRSLSARQTQATCIAP